MRRGAVFVAAALALAVFGAGCGKKEETIRIGVAAQLTGREAKMGSDFTTASPSPLMSGMPPEAFWGRG